MERPRRVGAALIVAVATVSVAMLVLMFGDALLRSFNLY
jgi:hypothetical protein